MHEFAPLFVEGSAVASGVVEGDASIAVIPVALEAGADLLADVEQFLRRYVYFASSAQTTAATLFVAHTWAFAAAEVTPYLHVTSAEAQSGKTLLLDLLRLLCRGPPMAADTTAAALFRSIGDPPPTILFDEVQELFGRNVDEGQRELRAVLNAGYRLGGNVRRCVGEGFTVAEFPVFCPKVLAGTGRCRPCWLPGRCQSCSSASPSGPTSSGSSAATWRPSPTRWSPGWPGGRRRRYRS